MIHKRHNWYHVGPFSPETPLEEFYNFIDSSELAERCEDCMGDVIKCRTIGILSSSLGKYYLSNVNDSDIVSKIRVSLLYFEEETPSAVIPYAVQIFGELQWKNKPVLFARVIQPMTASIAIRINKCLNDIRKIHLANNVASPEILTNH